MRTEALLLAVILAMSLYQPAEAGKLGSAFRFTKKVVLFLPRLGYYSAIGMPLAVFLAWHYDDLEAITK